MITRRLAMLSPGPVLAALGAAGGGAWLLKTTSWLETEILVAGAARLAGGLAGAAAGRTPDGWTLAFAGQPLLVTAACSATDFFLMTAALLGWHFARRLDRTAWFPVAAAGALLAAVPFTVAVNALRLVAVAHAHRWVGPRLPAACGPFLHMLAGVAVFLPALIALNLLLEYHGRSRTASRA